MGYDAHLFEKMSIPSSQNPLGDMSHIKLPEHHVTIPANHTDIIIAVVAIVIVAIVVNWIVNSAFICSYGFPIMVGLGGIIFALSKFSLALKRKSSYYSTFAILVLLIVGGWFITDTEVGKARIGSIILGLAFIIDLVYMIAAKFKWKHSIDTMTLASNVIGDLLLSIAFFYPLSKTN